ncbi:MAG: DUF5610 domain-containing protein [Deltaproteobacteria bacterium]|nr:DUF5610 domain-containing protein [Deltaproteobacteria bacterium]
MSNINSAASIHASVNKQSAAETKISLLDSIRTKKAKRGRSAASESGRDKVDVDMKKIYKSLTVLGDEVIRKLNGILKSDLPQGIASLKPEEHTPEATAQRIVDGTTALFSIYQKQNPNLQGEELLDSFMQTIRGGIKQGYDDAVGILSAIGAFEFDNVEEGIEKTMQLVEEKLTAFEDNFRKQLSEQPATDSKPTDTTAPAAQTK